MEEEKKTNNGKNLVSEKWSKYVQTVDMPKELIDLWKNRLPGDFDTEGTKAAKETYRALAVMVKIAEDTPPSDTTKERLLNLTCNAFSDVLMLTFRDCLKALHDLEVEEEHVKDLLSGSLLGFIHRSLRCIYTTEGVLGALDIVKEKVQEEDAEQ